MAVDIIVVSHHGSINAHEDAGAETTDLFTSMEMQVHEWIELQALVYDILPSATAAVFSYAIGSRKLSANEQFFVGAQTVVTKSDRIWRKVSESDARSVWLVQVACWLQNLQAWMFAEASVISSRVCPQPARRHAHWLGDRLWSQRSAPRLVRWVAERFRHFTRQHWVSENAKITELLD